MAEMKKTTLAHCKKCVYAGKMPDFVCCYLLDTGERRGCPVGYCDKFKEGRRKKIQSVKLTKKRKKESLEYGSL